MYLRSCTVIIVCAISLWSGEHEGIQKPEIFDPCSIKEITYYLDLLNGLDQLNDAEQLYDPELFTECQDMSFYYRAYGSLLQNRIEESLRYYNEIVADQDPYLLNLNARLKLKKRDYDSAIQIWERIDHPEYPCDLRGKIFNGMGTAYYFKSDYEMAETFFHKADNVTRDCPEADPIRVYILQNKALPLTRNRQYSQAIDLYSSFLNNNDLIANAATRGLCYSNLSVVYRRLGSYFLALDAQIQKLLTEGVTEEEVERAKLRMRAAAVYARDSLSTGARVIGTALTTGQTIADVEAWPQRIGAVTAAQVNAAARAILLPERSVTGLLLPKPAS